MPDRTHLPAVLREIAETRDAVRRSHASGASTLAILRAFRCGTHHDRFYARLDGVCRAARTGDLPQCCDQVAYGIAWSTQTGRIAASYERALRQMAPATLAALIRSLCDQCTCINDVPRALIALCAHLEGD